MIHSFGHVLGQDIPGGQQQRHPDFRSDVEINSSQLSVQNYDNADIAMARTTADQIINTSGAVVEIFIRTDNEDHDRVWDEDADPTYWPRAQLKAFFKPQPIELQLKGWGLEIENPLELVFSHQQVLDQFGERMLRAGDMIRVPYNLVTHALNPTLYKVENGTPSGNYRYVWLYFTCKLESANVDQAVMPEPDPQASAQPSDGPFYEV